MKEYKALMQSYMLPSLLLGSGPDREKDVPRALLYRFESEGRQHYVAVVGHKNIRAKMSFQATEANGLLLRGAVAEGGEGDEATILLGLLWDSVPQLKAMGYGHLILDFGALYASEAVAQALSDEFACYAEKTRRFLTLDLEAAAGIVNTVL